MAYASTLGRAWASYTPAWTSNGTAPSLMNGTFTGLWTQVGKTVFFRFDLTFGSSTTFGTGAYRFGIPVPAVALSTNHGLNVTGYAENAGIQGLLVTAGQYVSTTAIVLLTHDAAKGNSVAFAADNPIVWGSGDFIRCSGFYEAS